MLAFRILNPIFLLAMRIFSLCVFFVTILSAFGGKINPAILTFPSLLCLAFPYLAILTIILTVFWALYRKIFFCGLGVLTIVACLTPLSIAFPLGSERTAPPGATTFKIMSWNVLHTDDIREPEYEGNRAVEFMLGSGADIICLAELTNFSSHELKNLTPALSDSLKALYPHRAGLNSTDIKIMSKFPVERLDYPFPAEYGNCRFDFFKIFFPENKFLVVGMVHLYSYDLSEEERTVVTEINSVETAKTSMKEFRGPIRNKLSNAFRKRAENATNLRTAIDDIALQTPLIVCGDFNDVPASWTYNIVKGDDMHDAYVETNFGPAITYNLHAFYFHIDQMLYRGPITPLKLTIDKINTSDHYPLIGEFAFL